MSSTINDLPTTGIPQPVAATGQPIAVAGQPIAVAGQPVAATGQAVAAAGSGISPQMQELTPARKAWVENVTILLNHKKLILWTTLVVTAITAVYTFGFMPNYYAATSVVVPARKPGGGLDNAITGLSSSLKDLGLAKLSGGKGEESYTPVSLMASRTLQEKLVRQFGLMKLYGADDMDEALKEFNKNLTCHLSEEGNFIVNFDDVSPARAAAVTNAAVVAMNELDSRLAKEEARHNSMYIAERYQRNLQDLDSAEAALGAFQKKHGLYIVQEQARAELSTVASLELQKSMAEIELKNALEMFGANSNEAVSIRNSIGGLESKLEELRTGQDSKASSFVPTNVMPELALQFLRLTREFEIQSKLKAFFLPMYEQASLDEHRNLLSFITLDQANVPIKKAGPHRSLFLLGALLSGLILSSIVVIVVVRFESMRTSFHQDQALLSK
jgi:tyrosine-protein kinase Etk/Wzc